MKIQYLHGLLEVTTYVVTWMDGKLWFSITTCYSALSHYPISMTKVETLANESYHNIIV